MLFILELAQNHSGSLDRGKEIIQQFYHVTKQFPEFKFAFKFQRRDLPTFIHPDYINSDNAYVKRFQENQITVEELQELKEYAQSLGYLTICTPFDEVSVQTVKDLGFDYIKIGSCSITDWPLLNKVADTNMPVIGSVGGTSIHDIRKVVTFFKNRQIPLILMYCVGLYPCVDEKLSLNQLDMLHKEFPDIQIGFSTHESPTNLSSVQIAIGKGVSIFEKHVDIEECGNKYSITPGMFGVYLKAAQQAEIMCEVNNSAFIEESEKLRTLQRGAYLKRDIKKGENIGRDDLFFAFPIGTAEHLSAKTCSKYVSFNANKDIAINSPLDLSSVTVYDNSEWIEKIREQTKKMLDDNNIIYPTPCPMEISHHYGIDDFYTNGMCLLTLVNNVYCKKLLVIQPRQKNPEHYHKEKQETFFILAGSANIIVDGWINHLTQGNIIHIKPYQKHSISSAEGTVIEELSSTHMMNDSFYTDDTINNNHNRKTLIYV